MMNRRSKEIMTIVVVAATIILITGFIVLVALFKTENIDREQMIIYGSFLSTTLTTMVILYAVLVTSNKSTKDQYLDYLNSKDADNGADIPESDNESVSDGNDKSDKSE